MDKKKLYMFWFDLADMDRDGRVTGKARLTRTGGSVPRGTRWRLVHTPGSNLTQDAVPFFSRSGLPRELLARVWALADQGRTGFLDLRTFAKALDLISLAQQGQEISHQARERHRKRAPAPQLPPNQILAPAAVHPDDQRRDCHCAPGRIPRDGG